ncbi:cyclin-dependent kinase inhibitor 1 isoform X1 [Carassius auratus]|uniref:Cyclin-dependent kinase inhibitor 1 isoform X1 n=2 Tax=Carassius auratus TaxID=7957 RepID=A0A6P6IZ79_CARAU|nr:cyclin-dependent kinase inhibitor 1-like isoform X1 [Carassius auratus]XP_052445942.1 cyclin-dependent kinase inhibitor 1 isoform X1 [Carassius gibelio]
MMMCGALCWSQLCSGGTCPHISLQICPDTLQSSGQGGHRAQTLIVCFLMQMEMHKRILRALRSGPARRNLFGPVDREQLQLEYRDALRKDLEEASHRWGFDFTTETPLQGGDFQWEGVSGVKVPVLYRSSLEEHPSRTGPSRVGKENIPRTPERYSIVPQNMEKTPEKRTELKRKQTNITDFYQAKKRVVATPRKSGQ